MTSVSFATILVFIVTIFVSNGTNGKPSDLDHLTDNDPLPDDDEIENWRNLLSDEVYDYHVNKQISSSMLESDIFGHETNDDGVPLEKEKPIFYSGLKNGIQMFNAIEDRSLRWENGTVPYEIRNSFTPDERTTIEEALDDMMTKTCVRFVLRDRQQDYLSFENRGLGCSSYLARSSGKQVIDLAPGCTRKIGEVQHEVMHALGFYHEQSRNDRDKHVKIIWSNVIPGLEGQFNKYRSDPQNMPYDYESIMHYGWNYFARDSRKPTILPLTGNKIALGTREVMSSGDVEKINRLYECPNIKRVSPSPFNKIRTPATTKLKPTVTTTSTTRSARRSRRTTDQRKSGTGLLSWGRFKEQNRNRTRTGG